MKSSEEGNGTPFQYSCLENPWTEEPGRSLRVRHDRVTSLSLFSFMHCRRKWQPTPVFLPGESQGQQSLVGFRLWGRTESGMTESTYQQQQQHEKLTINILNSSVQFSRSVMSNSLLSRRLQRGSVKASVSITNSQSLRKLMSIESVMPSNHFMLSCPLLLLPSIFPRITFFSNESVLRIRWPKYWSFSFNISPFNEYSGLISFRKDWLDVLAVQGTLKSLLQHHSSNASILWHSAFFIFQLSHPFMTTGKAIALTKRTFVAK